MNDELTEENNNDSKKEEHNYGDNMFNVLYHLFVIGGFLLLIYSIFAENFALIAVAVQVILISYIYKFMESVILLLKEVKQQLAKKDNSSNNN